MKCDPERPLLHQGIGRAEDQDPGIRLGNDQARKRLLAVLLGLSPPVGVFRYHGNRHNGIHIFPGQFLQGMIDLIILLRTDFLFAEGLIDFIFNLPFCPGGFFRRDFVLRFHFIRCDLDLSDICRNGHALSGILGKKGVGKDRLQQHKKQAGHDSEYSGKAAGEQEPFCQFFPAQRSFFDLLLHKIGNLDRSLDSGFLFYGICQIISVLILCISGILFFFML